jgi:hypothetical protein
MSGWLSKSLSSAFNAVVFALFAFLCCFDGLSCPESLDSWDYSWSSHDQKIFIPHQVRIQLELHCLCSFSHPMALVFFLLDLMLGYINLPSKLHANFQFVNEIKVDLHIGNVAVSCKGSTASSKIPRSSQ